MTTFLTLSKARCICDTRITTLGFPGSASSKEPIYRCRRPQSCGLDSWVGKTPGGGHGKNYYSS